MLGGAVIVVEGCLAVIALFPVLGVLERVADGVGQDGASDELVARGRADGHADLGVIGSALAVPCIGLLDHVLVDSGRIGLGPQGLVVILRLVAFVGLHCERSVIGLGELFALVRAVRLFDNRLGCLSLAIGSLIPFF